MDDVRWAPGILDRGDRNNGWIMYLYSSRRRMPKRPSKAKEIIVVDEADSWPIMKKFQQLMIELFPFSHIPR